MDYDRSTILINETSLYSQIMRSKRSEAMAFKRWVCSEVQPDLRNHGVYVTRAASIERIRNPTG